MGGQPDRPDTHTCPGGVLKLGLNFALAPSKLPLTDNNDLRGHVCGILRRAKVPRSNLTKDQKTAMKELRRLHVESDEILVNFDVSSPFTNVPVG